MTKPYISIRIYVQGYPSPEDIEVVLQLPEEYIYKYSRSIDFPDKNCDSLTENLFCTRRDVRASIIEGRSKFVKDITPGIAEALINFLSKNDTVMGYRED